MFSENLPEAYVVFSDNGRAQTPLTLPTYEALAPCQIIMQSPETGQIGPTMVEAGEVFSTEAVPCQAWRPLNRAAGERIDQWLASLPVDTRSLPQEAITEAAYMMRPREGEPEVPHEQWWPAVLALAVRLHDKKQSRAGAAPVPGAVFRPHAPNSPVMPFAASGPMNPADVGRPPPGPAAQPTLDLPSGRKVATRAGRGPAPSPMPNANVSDALSSTSG